MTIYRNPDRQCRNKVRYASKKLAKHAAQKQESVLHARLSAYHCPWCYQYHLGNKWRPPKEQPMQGDIEIWHHPNDDPGAPDWQWAVRLDDDPTGEAVGGFADTETQALTDAELARQEHLG